MKNARTDFKRVMLNTPKQPRYIIPGEQVATVISAQYCSFAESILRQMAVSKPLADGWFGIGRNSHGFIETSQTEFEADVVVTYRSPSVEVTRNVRLVLGRREGLFLQDDLEHEWYSLKDTSENRVLRIGDLGFKPRAKSKTKLVVETRLDALTSRCRRAAENIIAAWVVQGTGWTSGDTIIQPKPWGGGVRPSPYREPVALSPLVVHQPHGSVVRNPYDRYQSIAYG